MVNYFVTTLDLVHGCMRQAMNQCIVLVPTHKHFMNNFIKLRLIFQLFLFVFVNGMLTLSQS